MVLNLKMITEDYCSYEVAKLLKEKGFPMIEYLYMHVNKDNVFMTDDYACLKLPLEEYHHFDEIYIPTITHQMALKWLRSRGTFIEVKIGEFGDKFIYFLTTQNGCGVWGKDSKVIGSPAHVEYDNYEDAVEAALKYSLTNLL